LLYMAPRLLVRRQRHRPHPLIQRRSSMNLMCISLLQPPSMVPWFAHPTPRRGQVRMCLQPLPAQLARVLEYSPSPSPMVNATAPVLKHRSTIRPTLHAARPTFQVAHLD
jgi:hypothetical protein